MKRVWIALTVVAVALVMAMPVGAAVDCDDPKFASNPTCSDAGDVIAYEVTMEFLEGQDGFSTSIGCTDDGAVLMDLTAQGDLSAVLDRPQFLDVRIGEALQWERHFPYFATVADANAPILEPNLYPSESPEAGNGITGCHGGGIEVTIAWNSDGEKVLDESNPDREPIVQNVNLFRLTPSDGAIELLWHSDYYIEYENVGNKKPRYIGNYGEDFTYSGAFTWTDEDEMGAPVAWDPTIGASGIVEGNVGVSHWWKDSDTAGYTPFPVGGEAGFPVRFLLRAIGTRRRTKMSRVRWRSCPGSEPDRMQRSC